MSLKSLEYKNKTVAQNICIAQMYLVIGFAVIIDLGQSKTKNRQHFKFHSLSYVHILYCDM